MKFGRGGLIWAGIVPAALVVFALVSLMLLAPFSGKRHDAVSQRRQQGHPHALSSRQGPIPIGRHSGVTYRRGSCLKFPPRTPSRHETVFLDAGHGGPDPGTAGITSSRRTVLEKNLTLDVAMQARRLLVTHGYTVVMSRTRDTFVAGGPGMLHHLRPLTATEIGRDLRARITCSNVARADVFISIHMNGFSWPSVGGAETLYCSDRPFHRKSRRLGEAVERQVVAALRAAGWRVYERGVVDDLGKGSPGLSARAREYDHLLELGPKFPHLLKHPTAMPGVILEPLFITNPGESDIAVSRKGQRAIAQGVLHAADNYFGSTRTDASPPSRRAGTR